MKPVEIILIVIAILTAFFLIFSIVNLNKGTPSIKTSPNSDKYASIPEKCRPDGQDIESWKQHLSHHEETKDCIRYFILEDINN
jgi:hypothetical protein